MCSCKYDKCDKINNVKLFDRMKQWQYNLLQRSKVIIAYELEAIYVEEAASPGSIMIFNSS